MIISGVLLFFFVLVVFSTGVSSLSNFYSFVLVSLCRPFSFRVLDVDLIFRVYLLQFTNGYAK